jgi:hypothetical protein
MKRWATGAKVEARAADFKPMSLANMRANGCPIRHRLMRTAAAPQTSTSTLCPKPLPSPTPANASGAANAAARPSKPDSLGTQAVNAPERRTIGANDRQCPRPSGRPKN